MRRQFFDTLALNGTLCCTIGFDNHTVTISPFWLSSCSRGHWGELVSPTKAPLNPGLTLWINKLCCQPKFWSTAAKKPPGGSTRIATPGPSGASMNTGTGTKMKRSAAVRKAEEHDRANPFCAAHPELSSHIPAVQSDPEDVPKTFRRDENVGIRAHVRADHVMVTKKRK
jgi:hypothetical protein